MAPGAQGVWHITGIGTMARVVPTNSIIFVFPTSQFYNKAVQHEQVHVAQWNPGRIGGDLFIPSDLFNQVQGFTGAAQTDLLSQYTDARAGYRPAHRIPIQQRRNATELE